VVSTALHRDDVEEKLKGYLGRYKHGDDVFDKINANYDEAVKRAKQMLRKTIDNKTQPVDANPSTTIYLLTEELHEGMS
jgi:6-phosphogluconate dehydrogenase (decarboxylating)